MNEMDKPQLNIRDVRRIAKEMEAARGPGAFLKVSVAAAVVGLNPATIRKWIRQGRVRAFGYRGCLHVDPRDLLPPFDNKKV